MPGSPRVRTRIVGGFIIPYTEGVAWLKRDKKLAINPDHSEDLSIPCHLASAVEEHNFPYDIEQVRQGPGWYKTMLVTQWASGSFVNVGPPDVEEIPQDDLKGMLKPGPEEDEARDTVLRDLGWWTHRVNRASWN